MVVNICFKYRNDAIILFKRISYNNQHNNDISNIFDTLINNFRYFHKFKL